MTPISNDFEMDKKAHIWEATKAIFRFSPLLKPVKPGNLWLHDGDVDREIKDLVADMCPWIMATPSNTNITNGDKETIITPLYIEIDYAVRGYNVTNLINMWGAIEKAFGLNGPSPNPDKTVYEYLRDIPEPASGIYEPILKFSGLKATRGANFIRGTGAFNINLRKQV